MYSYIIGKITDKTESAITLENGGIGYELTLSSFALKNLSDVDGEVKVYTHYQQRDDGVGLFGFYSKEEKTMFQKLITVSGIGPKVAISVLSNISVDDLCVVISTGDLRSLSKVKGIGKKTAERLLIELKDKVTITGQISTFDKSIEPKPELNDACDILASLGLNRFEAERLVKNCYEEGDSVETVVTKALGQMRS